MNTYIERFVTPKLVTKYYDRTILISPMFLLLTVLFAFAFLETFHLVRNWTDVLLVVLPIVAVWIHLIVQHRWFRNVEDPQILKRNAARTTLAFSVLYVVTIGALLARIPR